MSARRLLALAALAGVLAGCAGSMLPYTPVQQPAGFPISADYKVVGDRLRVEIDTRGYRLEDAQIVRAEGAGIPAQTIEHPGPRGAGSGVGVGLGIGSAGRSGSVGIGTGVGIGTTLGGGGRVEGNTLAWFPLDHVGPGPWRLRVKVVGVQPTDILLPAPAR